MEIVKGKNLRLQVRIFYTVDIRGNPEYPFFHFFVQKNAPPYAEKTRRKNGVQYLIYIYII